MIDTQTVGTNKKKINSRERERLIFYTVLIALPVIQFCIFYIFINFNSIILSFKNYKVLSNGNIEITFAGFENYKTALQIFSSRAYMFKNSLKLFISNTLLGITLSLIFSFYLYKQYKLAGLYKVILFLPKIIPGIVFSLLFKYMATDAYSALTKIITGTRQLGLLDNSKTVFNTVLFYNLWISFGVSVILFTGAMSGINESVVESAQLDGVNVFQEFIHITIPMIFPTLVTFIIVGIATAFTNQMELFTIFGSGREDIGTVGYFIYVNAQQSDVIAKNGYYSYSILSAFGVILTALLLPITLLVKYLLEKFGPSAD